MTTRDAIVENRPVVASFALDKRFSDNVGGDLKSARILIIDDSAAIRVVIVGLLRNYGYVNLVEAADGAEGLEVVNNWHPDIVITDLLMPNMDGFEFCHRMRSSKATSDIPILIQTCMGKSEERTAVFSAGACDMIAKPIDPQELLARLRLHLERRRLIGRLSEFQRRMGQELDLARAMQESLLPDEAHLRQLESRYPVSLASYYEASIGLGGDIWGLVPIDDHRLKVFSTDFAGHGVGAALNTFRLHSFMVSGSEQADTAAAWLDQLNQYLCGVLPIGQFATMFCGIIDFAAGELQYASASAPAQLIRNGDPGDRFYPVDGTGFPLGLNRQATYENHTCAFGPGSTLFLYSDALIETPDPPDAVFTAESLCAFLDCEDRDLSPQMLQNAVLRQLDSCAQAKPEDDLTIVALQYRYEVK